MNECLVNAVGFVVTTQIYTLKGKKFEPQVRQASWFLYYRLPYRRILVTLI